MIGIRKIKNQILNELCENLNLYYIDAPIFLEIGTGLQDNLSGTETSIKFKSYEIPHSLAKWKRKTLYELELSPGQGILTDMKAIRQDEILDDLHSYFVDQYDWEKVITKEERTDEYLENTVRKIWSSIVKVSKDLSLRKLQEEVYFFNTECLLNEFDTDYDIDDINSHTKLEYNLCKKYKVVFLKHINDKLGRSPDYDDWNLNGDLLVYDDIYDRVIELSSMGIRVDETSLKKQMKDKPYKQYHYDIPHYPLTIGGGIGQSRVCMFLLCIKSIFLVQPK